MLIVVHKNMHTSEEQMRLALTILEQMALETYCKNFTFKSRIFYQLKSQSSAIMCFGL